QQAVQLSPEDLEQLKDVEAEYDQFVSAADDHDKRMRAVAHREYDARVADLEKRYAERIAKTEADKADRHTRTIAKLEKFIADHPGHKQFTPDAMFRLADLYLDEADEEVDKRLAAQEAAPPDPNAPDAASIVADYTKYLDLWEKILK